MSGPMQTSVFLVLWAAAAGIWELYVLYRFGAPATISYVIVDWGRDYPILALILGVLMGHFFWQFNRCR